MLRKNRRTARRIPKRGGRGITVAEHPNFLIILVRIQLRVLCRLWVGVKALHRICNSRVQMFGSSLVGRSAIAHKCARLPCGLKFARLHFIAFYKQIFVRLSNDDLNRQRKLELSTEARFDQ